MLVTLPGIVKLLRSLQLENALLAIPVTPYGMIKSPLMSLGMLKIIFGTASTSFPFLIVANLLLTYVVVLSIYGSVTIFPSISFLKIT